MHGLFRNDGFTLIELMVVIVIIGILAAIATPAFISYIKRSKTSEVATNLKTLFTGAATYYDLEQWSQGIVTSGSGAASAHCTVADDLDPGYTASDTKHIVDWVSQPSFKALNFSPGDPVYFEYTIDSATAACDQSGNTTLYTFSAHGDLDADGTQSTFELSVGSNAENVLFRSPSFYVVNEIE